MSKLYKLAVTTYHIEEDSCLEQCLQTFDNSIQYYDHVINHSFDIEEKFGERFS